MQDDQQYKKCQTAAFHLLKVRLRSEMELQTRLKQKRFTKDIIQKTIIFLKSIDFIDDDRFAHDWVSYRLKSPFGPNRIRFELQQKGVSKDLTEKHLLKALESFREEETVWQLAQERAAKYSNLDKDKIKRRVHGFLVRRGFQPALIYKAIQKL